MCPFQGLGSIGLESRAVRPATNSDLIGDFATASLPVNKGGITDLNFLGGGRSESVVVVEELSGLVIVNVALREVEQKKKEHEIE